MNWNIYLSGEIHTDWREQIQNGAVKNQLPVSFTSTVTDHAASDAAAMAWAQTPEQVVEILKYVISKQ